MRRHRETPYCGLPAENENETKKGRHTRGPTFDYLGLTPLGPIVYLRLLWAGYFRILKEFQTSSDWDERLDAALTAAVIYSRVTGEESRMVNAVRRTLENQKLRDVIVDALDETGASVEPVSDASGRGSTVSETLCCSEDKLVAYVDEHLPPSSDGPSGLTTIDIVVMVVRLIQFVIKLRSGDKS